MWPEGSTAPFRGDKGTTWEGGVRVPALIRWPGHIQPGQVSADIFAMEDWFPTLAAMGGEPDTVAKLLKGQQYGAMNYKVHLDGFDQTDFLTGKSPKSARNHVFYYDEANLTAVRMALRLAVAALLATIRVHRCQSHQGGDLLAIQFSKFG